MHRVQNYGSVLQAYALQRKIKELGFASEIIDYRFPNKRRKPNFQSRLKSALGNIIDFSLGLHSNRKSMKIKQFLDSHLIMTPRSYATSSELMQNPPKFDLYITGSDQVWSPHHVKDDLSFLFSFASPDAPRISYAASFGKGTIPENLQTNYSELLKRYGAISVREQSGVDQVRQLADKSAEWVCDPTLLLTKEEWTQMESCPQKKVKQPYLLAYILTYSFNPYPGITRLIHQIAQQMNLQVVLLNGPKKDFFAPRTSLVNDAGPEEFIHLFQNADFIVTTSFHGTAFALNFEKPFISVVYNKKTAENIKCDKYQKDERVVSLLSKMNAEDRALTPQQELSVPLKMNYSKITPELVKFRKLSLSYLKNAIESNIF